MESKVAAAEVAAGAGIPTVIAAGDGDGVLTGILAGARRGTRFAAAESAPAFKLWLRHGKRVDGRINVDAGAQRAVVDGGGEPARGRRHRLGRRVPRRATASSSSAPTVWRSRAASPPSTPRELVGKPVNVEAVHRDRLVLT